MSYSELNLDGLVGPSHHYAGLARGNLASQRHRGKVASPREAALQGLEKMWRLHGLGIPQAVLPPPLRPRLDILRALGFCGDDAEVLEKAYQHAPQLLSACYSASAMWAANAATVSCSADAADHRVHFTPANLTSHLHRSLEAGSTAHTLRQIFADSSCFSHHPPLPACAELGDEGAANHTRLCFEQGDSGLNLFVWGQASDLPQPHRFPARQARLASERILHSHRLSPERCQLIQQLPTSIDRGVFHNDVIAVGHRNLLLLHEESWADQAQVLTTLRQRWQHEAPLCISQIPGRLLTVEEAVASYLFNSQLVSLPNHAMLMLAPEECHDQPRTRAVIDQLLAEDNPLFRVEYFNLHQSMDNGGGPACLRLRVPLSDAELVAMHQGVRLTPTLYRSLRQWITQHYRDRLALEDLRDPALPDEIRTALGALRDLLDLPALYPGL